MKLVLYSALLFLVSANALYAQSEQTSRGVGVSPYTQPTEATYRLLFGGGANAGLGLQSPQSMIGIGTYQRDNNVFSAAIISSNPVSGGLPRRTNIEFDLLYGLALDNTLLSYARPTDQFHASLSAGISLNDYSTNWRRFGGNHQTAPIIVLEPRNTSQLSPGLPVQLQAVYEPFRFAGIGAILFYDVSALQPSYGGAIVLELRY